jgi:chitin disaccharide deacetylase
LEKQTVSSTRLILCADDYALSPAVSRGIVSLLEQKRISATSCMTLSRFWPEEAQKLLPFFDQMDIGLHLTLTDSKPLSSMPSIALTGSLPSINTLMSRALGRQLNSKEIEREINHQLLVFEEEIGAPPKFVDGHHHIHQLPVIGELLLKVLSERYPHQLPWVRICWENPLTLWRRHVSPAKGLAIGLFGWFLRRKAHRLGVITNTGFGGVHDFTYQESFASVMERTLAHVCHDTVIMCHPGWVDDALRQSDSLVDGRQKEWDYLHSEDFAALLTQQKIILSPLQR